MTKGGRITAAPQTEQSSSTADRRRLRGSRTAPTLQQGRPSAHQGQEVAEEGHGAADGGEDGDVGGGDDKAGHHVAWGQRRLRVCVGGGETCELRG